MSSKVNGLQTKSLKKGKHQTITSFNTELVVVWTGAGCNVDRVWIGLDPGLDRPGSGPTCLCMLQLGCSMRCASSKCTAWLLGRLALQFATVSASQFDSLDSQQLQLGCWTSWLLGSVALQQFVAWLLGQVNNCRAGNPKTCNHHWTKHQLTNTLYPSKGLDQRSGSNPFEWSGSEVWIVCGYMLSRSHLSPSKFATSQNVMPNVTANTDVLISFWIVTVIRCTYTCNKCYRTSSSAPNGQCDHPLQTGNTAVGDTHLAPHCKTKCWLTSKKPNNKPDVFCTRFCDHAKFTSIRFKKRIDLAEMIEKILNKWSTVATIFFRPLLACRKAGLNSRCTDGGLISHGICFQVLCW